MNRRDSTGSNNSNWRGGKLPRGCLQCDSIFYSYSETAKFCSRKCYNKAQRDTPPWNKGKTKDKTKPNYDPRMESVGLSGEGNPRYGDHRSFITPEGRAKIRAGKLGDKNPMWVPFEDRACPTCGEIFTVKRTSKRRFCSNSCSKKGDLNPMRNPDTAKKVVQTNRERGNYKKGGLVEMWSERREEMLEIVRSYMTGDNNPMKDPEIVQRSLRNRDSKKRPNNLELHFQKFLKECGLPFKYVGNSRFFITCKGGRTRNPDFIHVERGIKVLIEIGARHWHPDPNEIDMMKSQYLTMGWICLFFYESDIYGNSGMVRREIFNVLG